MRGVIFVGGSGRSGTSLIAKLLAAHPTIDLVPRELRVHSDPGGLTDWLAGRVAGPWLERRMRGYWMTRTSPTGDDRSLLRFCADREEYLAAVDRFSTQCTQDREAAARGFIEDLVSSSCVGGTAWVEMSPPNAAALGGLQRLFPDARFIHAVRGGLDVAASLLRMAWAPDAPCDCLMFWADRVVDGARAAQETPSAQHAIVHMEDLVGDPGGTLGALCEALDLPRELPELPAIGTIVQPGRAHIGRWEAEIDHAEQPKLIALYIAQCARISRLDPACVPSDAHTAQQALEHLPEAERRAAQRAAKEAASGWRKERAQQWRWQPGWRMRAAAKVPGLYGAWTRGRQSSAAAEQA